MRHLNCLSAQRKDRRWLRRSCEKLAMVLGAMRELMVNPIWRNNTMYQYSNAFATFEHIFKALLPWCEPGKVYELRAPATRSGVLGGYYDDLDQLAEDAAYLS